MLVYDNISFAACRFCSKDPTLLQEQAGEDIYYLVTCETPGCENVNKDVYDDLEACAEAWNSKQEEVGIGATDTQGVISEGD